MPSTAIAAALQDAMEKGDVLELEQAIAAAEDAMHVSTRARKTSSSLQALIAQAKELYLVHLEACWNFLKPLRRACKELNERGIFDALVQARGATDEVQLCMYTDLCNAESLRHEIVKAQKMAVKLLDATVSEDVDIFLSECSPLLEDRTILALVQKREDLLREERRRLTERGPPLRSASRTAGRHAAAAPSSHGARRDPVAGLSRAEMEDSAGRSPFERALRSTSPSQNSRGSRPPYPFSERRRVGAWDNEEEEAEEAGLVARPRSSAAVPVAYPAIQDALSRNRDSVLHRAVAEGASPWMQAMRALRHQAYEEVAREEHDSRRRLEEGEEESRARFYRQEMLARVQCWADHAMLSKVRASDYDESDEASSLAEEESREDEEPVCETVAAGAMSSPPTPTPSSRASASPAWVRLPPPPPLTSSATTAALRRASPAAGFHEPAGRSPARVYATTPLPMNLYPSQRYPTPSRRTPREAAELTAAAASGSGTPADGAIFGSALRQRLLTPAGGPPPVEEHTPRLSRDTPNISPIKEGSTMSAVASMWGQDALLQHQRRAGDVRLSDATSPRHRGAVRSGDNNSGSLATSNAEASVSRLGQSPPALELRRIQARLRAVLQEEDIHRRDIEGTEDFDRSVFLFPVSARIAMLRRSAAQRFRAT